MAENRWIHIDDQKPEEGKDLFYFFPFLGVYKGKYQKVNYYEGHDDIEPCWGDCFYGSKGFLTDDVTHWMYCDGQEELPDVPEGYIEIHDGKFREYALEEDTVRITKREYEQLREWIKELEQQWKTRNCDKTCFEEGCDCEE